MIWRDDDFMKWINAEESPPKKDGKYFVYTKNLTGYKPLEDNVFVAQYAFGEWLFNGWEDNKVTHWMKLPKEPKE